MLWISRTSITTSRCLSMQWLDSRYALFLINCPSQETLILKNALSQIMSTLPIPGITTLPVAVIMSYSATLMCTMEVYQLVFYEKVWMGNEGCFWSHQWEKFHNEILLLTPWIPLAPVPPGLQKPLLKKLTHITPLLMLPYSWFPKIESYCPSHPFVLMGFLQEFSWMF